MSIPATATPVTATPASPAARLDSIDLLRGLIMVVMALDHVRDYFHFSAVQGVDPLDLARTTPAIFLTRFITHFCAPNFSFLAGIHHISQLYPLTAHVAGHWTGRDCSVADVPVD